MQLELSGLYGSAQIMLHEADTDLRTTIRVVPGGRVFQNPGWETAP